MTSDPADKTAWLDGRERAWRRAGQEASTAETQRSWLRLAFFAAALVVWFPLASQPLLAAGLCAALVLAFIGSVRAHGNAQLQRQELDRLLLIAGECRARLGGAVHCVVSHGYPTVDDKTACDLPRLLDDGPTWKLTGQERDDLDLFAPPVGVFGLLNRTSTLNGALRLAEMLQNPLISPEGIQKRQAAVRTLSETPEERLRMLAALAALRREDRRLARFVRALREVEPLKTPLPVTALRAWGVLSLLLMGGLGALMTMGDMRWGGLILLLLLINLTLYVLLMPALRGILHPWRDTGWAVRGCLIAAREAARRLPSTGELERLRAALEVAVTPDALPRLATRIGWAEGGGIIQFSMNTLYLHDLHVADRIDRPLRAHRDDILRGVAALAELEPLLSLGAFAWEQPVACWPEPVPETRLEIIDGRHPLVDPARVIPGRVTLDAGRRMWIITGSNMAGKSTLLRMTGVCVLLAQVGGAVPAVSMRWSPLRLLSDLRARDDLAAGESYFLAEVRHLRRMVCPPDGDAPLLGLIDEPFRGTNSQDQSAASIAVARTLIASGHLYLLATHDRHLTELADGTVARNFHFRENLAANGGMVFDYRLYDGPARTRNALRVLEAEGYPPDLMQAAHDWLAQTAEGDPYTATPGRGE